MISFMRAGDHKSAGDEFLFHIQCSHNIDKRGQQAASDRPEPPRSREKARAERAETRLGQRRSGPGFAH